MKQDKALTSDMAFIHPDTPMFSELITRLQADDALSTTRRRDMVSGLTRVAKALGRPSEAVPADVGWLQPRLARLNAAKLGLAEKSWQNAVSDARAAMVHFGIVKRRWSRPSDLSPAWQSLWKSARASGNTSMQAAICRFIYFLSWQGVGPDDVRLDHVLAFHEAVKANEIRKSPETAMRAAIDGWNLAMRRIPGWPQTRLQLPARKEVYLIPDAAFPDSFRRDLDALMAELVNPDPLSNAFFSRPVREVTAGIYRGQLRRFASELVHSGVEMAELQSVCILLEPQNAERGLRQMLKRTANKSTPLIRDIAALLRNLAKRTNRPVAVQDRLSELAKRVALPSQRGITRKNRDRLRVLQSEENTLRLLTLPERLFAAAPPGKPHSFSEVCALEDAVAIGILLVCPVRIGNLATIHLDRHFQRPGDGRVYLVFVEDETKNERPLEFELPAQLVSMIDRYLATRSPYRCPKGTPWLFSRRDGAGPVHSGQLAHRLSKRILKATGFEMNAHLFRHFAVMNWLNANPGGYEVARRLLGHAETSHTINMYSGLEITSATKAFADLIEAKRTAGRKTRGTRP